MTHHHLQTIIRTCLSVLLSFTLVALFPPTSHSSQFPDPQYEIPNAESPNWWQAAQRDIRQREYHITWQPSPLFPGESPGYQAPNREQNLRIGFGRDTIRFVPRTGVGSPWTLGLTLTSSKRGRTGSSVGAPSLSVHENHVTYARGPITERYTNQETGLGQELRILSPEYPLLSPSSPIALELGLTGDLIPHLADGYSTSLEQGNQAIQFGLADSSPVLQYTLLDVRDATNRQLSAKIELSPAHHIPQTLRITIDDTYAAYPITLRGVFFSLQPGTGSPSGMSSQSGFSQAWTGESDQDDARLGYALSTIGDVNGDGYSDLVVGVPWYDSGETDEGAAFVYYGGAYGLAQGSVDWITESNRIEAHFGYAVSLAGDVNGDGYADIVIGAPDYDGTGAVFVYHGSPNGLTSSADWTTVGDQENALFGTSVSTAGDLDGDGYTDVIVGARDYDGDQTDEGAAFVYHGSPTGLTAGSANWTAVGGQASAHLGVAVSTAGDVNGDGYADVLIGAPGYDSITGTTTLTDAGRAYVYLGSLTGLVTDTIGWMAGGEQAGSQFGTAVSTAGDANGDGWADILIGAPGYDVTGTAIFTDVGRVYAYYGRSTAGESAPFTDSPNWVANGDQSGAHFGAAVSIAGDLNSDGYADIAIGAPDYDDVQPNEGAAFVYQGTATGPSSGPTWSAHPIDQENAHFGTAVSTVGDVNGDGHGDIAIGATGYDHEHTDEGGAFVYHGSPGGLATSPSWSSTGGYDGALFGWSVATAGDVNGDGYADIIIGAPTYDRGQTEEGAAFLYTGGPAGPSTGPMWVGEGDQAWAWFGQAVASAGDVNGDGYADIIIGAPRYDGEQIDDGKVFVYHGSAAGPSPGAANWTAPRENQGTAVFGVSSRFGVAVSSVGDVNGDGYADIIVGANGYDEEETNEGAAFVYHGGPTGLSQDFVWAAHPTDQAYANYGRSVSTAGDVNGDGYSDAIVGAPWVAKSGLDAELDGTAYVYYGSDTGLAADANWTVTEVFTSAEFGTAVSTAGDVNGDGYSDVLVGAYKYTKVLGVTPWREGGAFVYHGSSTGLNEGPADWLAKSGKEQARFGISVSGAGDVNGDGYGDVIVGASSYDTGLAHEGAAFVYHGSPTGLAEGPMDWITTGNQERAALGFAVSTAGDVNGDGYGDILVGAPTYNARGTDEGAAFVYLGNGGAGAPLIPNQMRSDSLTPIAPLGRSNHANEVRLHLIGRSPLGRESVALQWQLAPLGIPFTATVSGTLSGTSAAWRDVLTTGVVLSQTVGGLAEGTVYRWRVRTLYHPGSRLGQVTSRWLYLPWNGPQEADFRTPHPLTPDISRATYLPLILLENGWPVIKP
jgi:hypothetical protein